MKRKIAQKEADLAGHHDSMVPLAVAGGFLGAVVGKAVGRTNGSTVTGAAIGAIAGALVSPDPSLGLPQVVDYLQRNLGPKTTAYLSGTDDLALVSRWANGTARPEEMTGKRLWFAYRATRSLVEAYDAKTARSWFLGMNPVFEDQAPARVLRNSHAPEIWGEVVLAAREFAET